SFVTPAFTTGKLKTMMEPIGRISNKFIEHLRVHAKTGDEFDIKRYIGGFVMDVITECAYGIKVSDDSWDGFNLNRSNAEKSMKSIISRDLCFGFIFFM